MKTILEITDKFLSPNFNFNCNCNFNFSFKLIYSLCASMYYTKDQTLRYSYAIDRSSR